MGDGDRVEMALTNPGKADGKITANIFADGSGAVCGFNRVTAESGGGQAALDIFLIATQERIVALKNKRNQWGLAGQSFF